MGLVLVSLSKDLGRDNTTAEETRAIYEEVVHFQWGASDKSTGVQDLPQPRCAKGWRFYTTWGCRAHLHSTRLSEHVLSVICNLLYNVMGHMSHKYLKSQHMGLGECLSKPQNSPARSKVSVLLPLGDKPVPTSVVTVSIQAEP